MGTKAVAIVHIHPDVIRAAFALAPQEQQDGAAGEVRIGADDNAYRMRFFDDAAALYLGVGLGFGEPDVMGVLVATALGEVIDQHDDPRGVPLIPDSYEPQASTWDGIVEELGDAADWVPVDSASPQEDPMQALLGAFGPGGPGGPDLMSLAAQLQGQDPATLMQQAMQVAQQLAQSGGFAQIQQTIQQMMPGMALPGMAMPPQRELVDAQLDDAQGEAATAPPVDLDAMTRQAQALIDANPQLMQQLLSQLGGVIDVEGEEVGKPKKK